MTLMPDNSDQGYLWAQIETEPANLQAAIRIARREAERLAGGDIDAAALASARRPLVTGLQAALTSNEVWLSALSGSASDMLAVQDILRLPSLVEEITLEEVRQAAATWMSKPPIIVTALPEPAAAGLTSAATPQ